SERRAHKRTARGFKRLAKRLHKRRSPVRTDELAAACAAEARPSSSDAIENPELAQSILASFRAGEKPSVPLARRTLRALAWTRWRRRIAFGLPATIILVAAAIALAIYIDYQRSGSSRFLATFIVWSVHH